MLALAIDGGALSPLKAVASVALQAGMPLVQSRVNGQLGIADASTKAFAWVAGLAAANTAQGFVAEAVQDTLTLPDWTAVTGSASLQVGQPYFLAAGGGLTTTPPASPACIAIVGMAQSASTFVLRRQPPIQL